MFTTIFNFISALIPTISIFACIWCMIKAPKGTVINNSSADKPWGFGTWMCAVLAAGMGVALVTNVPGDVAGLLGRGWSPMESISMVSLYNGIPVWALYSIVGYWYIKHMDSKFGKVMAMLSTVLGMSISLWTGSNAIARMVGISNMIAFKTVIAALIVVVALLSAKFNWLKKISRIAIALLLVSFIVLLSTDKGNINQTPITGTIFTKRFWGEYFFGDLSASWWSWFLLWCPTVSRWLAHISNGRTIKQYFLGSVIFPTVVCGAWVVMSYKYSDPIANMNLIANPSWWFPTLIFIVTGMLFMSATLDSDCKVFTEDLESITKGKLKQKSMILHYGSFVLFFFALYVSGIIANPWSFALFVSVVFFPIWGMSIKTALTSKK